MKICYGVEGKTIDVTDQAMYHFWKDGVLRIPVGDHKRANIFGDPVHGVEKSIFIHDDTGKTNVYDISTPVEVGIDDYTPEPRSHAFYHDKMKDLTGDERCRVYHKFVYLTGGSIWDEYPEQLMASMFLSPSARVLELGSNIGRNTLLIASILDDDTNLVTLETIPSTVTVLEKNKKDNGFGFHIVNAALSARPLIQPMGGWDSRPMLDEPIHHTDIIPSIVSFDELQKRFDIEFDTLIIDCEGAFYYILQDFPTMLDKIRLVIMENDYKDITHKHYVDRCLNAKGFQRVYVCHGGWGPCIGMFFETWSRPIV